MSSTVLIQNKVETIEWAPQGVIMIDQTKLPREVTFVTCATYNEVADAIRSMVVRGAPAIGVAAAMGIALGVRDSTTRNIDELRNQFEQITRPLGETRPTAVNLCWAIARMKRVFAEAAAKDSDQNSI